MKKDIKHFLDQSTIQLLYFRYKNYMPYVFAIFAAIALFVAIIIPQIQNLLEISQQEKDMQTKIATLKKNLIFLSALNEGELDEKLQTVSVALPPEKDFTGYLQAISQASAIAGVAIGDFSFQLGDVSLATGSVSQGQPAIEISLNITGGINENKRFIQELGKRLPISEVRSIKIGESVSSVAIIFYYKPFPSLRSGQPEVILPLSTKEELVIESLSAFR